MGVFLILDFGFRLRLKEAPTPALPRSTGRGRKSLPETIRETEPGERGYGCTVTTMRR